VALCAGAATTGVTERTHEHYDVAAGDRDPFATLAAGERARYREIMTQVTVMEVSGRPDFAALVDVVGDLLAR
jgi:hypothetical protein